MKKFILALAIMLISSPVFAAQQTILGGAGVLWGDEKGKINSNFSELYGKLAQALLTTSSPTFADLTLTSDLNLKDWIYFTSDDDTHYVSLAAGNNTANYILRWPTAAPGGSNYLLNFDADGTGAWTNPSTLGGDDLGSATYSTVTTLWASGSCSGYLKSDGTCDTPSGSMTYPGAGVPLSTGSAWGTSYTVGTAANNLVQLNASSQLPAVSAALLTNFPTLNQNTTGTAGGLSGTPNITVGTVTAAEYLTSAADGNRWAGPINTVAITATATLGRMAWLTDRYWLANGTNWTTRYFLDSSFIGSAVQAYDADLADLADGSLTASKVAGATVTTASKSSTYTIGTDSANESYGGTIYVASATTITAPAVATGMNFTVVTIGDIAVSLDVNASDKMILDGVTLADGDKATNSSKAGDTITCQYYSADGFYCWSGTVLGGHWTDGN